MGQFQLLPSCCSPTQPHVTRCHAVLSHATPHLTLSCHGGLCHTTQCCSMSCCTTLCHTPTCSTMSHHTALCPTVPLRPQPHQHWSLAMQPCRGCAYCIWVLHPETPPAPPVIPSPSCFPVSKPGLGVPGGWEMLVPLVGGCWGQRCSSFGADQSGPGVPLFVLGGTVHRLF